MNNQLYKYLIILLAMGNTSQVLASENEVTKKDPAVMPAAPSGPYRSHIGSDEKKKAPASSVANSSTQQPMPAPNFNGNRMQPMPAPQWGHPNVPDWVKNPPRAPKPPAWVTNPPAPPAWVNRSPQPMPAPQWVQPNVPDWVKNPPYGPKPPA